MRRRRRRPCAASTRCILCCLKEGSGDGNANGRGSGNENGSGSGNENESGNGNENESGNGNGNAMQRRGGVIQVVLQEPKGMVAIMEVAAVAAVLYPAATDIRTTLGGRVAGWGSPRLRLCRTRTRSPSRSCTPSRSRSRSLSHRHRHRHRHCTREILTRKRRLGKRREIEQAIRNVFFF